VKRLWMMLGAALLTAFVAAAVAVADGGGSSIAEAPEVPVGKGTQGGYPGNGCDPGEFWRITLARADHLRLDYGSLNGVTVVVYLYAPSVTDYTFSQARDLAQSGTSRKQELRYIAPAPGKYTLFFRTAECGADLAYELTAYIQHYTRATFTGPRVARAHTQISCKGRISGISSGKVVIQRKLRRWKKLALVSIRPDGSFRFTMRLGGPGKYRLRAFFSGDASHLASSAVYSLRAV